MSGGNHEKASYLSPTSIIGRLWKFRPQIIRLFFQSKLVQYDQTHRAILVLVCKWFQLITSLQGLTYLKNILANLAGKIISHNFWTKLEKFDYSLPRTLQNSQPMFPSSFSRHFPNNIWKQRSIKLGHSWRKLK